MADATEDLGRPNSALATDLDELANQLTASGALTDDARMLLRVSARRLRAGSPVPVTDDQIARAQRG